MAAVLIVGAGPGIATSVARRFAKEGLDVGLVARSSASINVALKTLASVGVRVTGVTADAAQESELKAALDVLIDRIGVPEVTVYNAGLIRFDRPGELSHDEHLIAYGINVLGALTTASYVGPRMADAGGGTIIITGGMPIPEPALVSLSLGKAGVRALTELLANEYGPRGIHVATITVCGGVKPGGVFDPDRIADHYLRVHRQPVEAWEREVVFAGDPAAA